MSSPQRKDAPPMVGSADTKGRHHPTAGHAEELQLMSSPQRKDAPPMVGSADTKGATIPPPDTRRSYN